MAVNRGKKVAVLGAGICGLSTAVRLQDADSSLDITIIADKFSPHTTSDGAAGFWEPLFMKDTPLEKQRRWGKKTVDYLNNFMKTEQAYHFKMNYCSGYILSDTILDTPFKDLFVRQIKLSEEDLRKNFPDDIIDGYLVTTIMFPATPYMQFTLKQFQKKGGKIVQKRVNSFDELAGKFDIVVNCTGLGSHELCKDEAIQPVRGQIIKMKAPWLNHFYIVEREKEINKGRVTYMFPRAYEVIVGGTLQPGNWDTRVSEKDTQYILDKAAEFIPTIKDGEIIEKWVGLRPVRKTCRLEKELVEVKSEYGSVRKLQVVHNYGHGGGGLSVFWGCAEEARDLVLSTLLASSL